MNCVSVLQSSHGVQQYTPPGGGNVCSIEFSCVHPMCASSRSEYFVDVLRSPYKIMETRQVQSGNAGKLPLRICPPLGSILPE